MLRQLRVPALVLTVVSCLLAVGGTAAEIPPGYYAAVDDSSPARLRATLHPVIDDHLAVPYSSDSAPDTWNVLEAADEDPQHPDRVLDVYRNASFRKVVERADEAGEPGYNREHAWPNSYGFPSRSDTPYTDCHALFVADRSYNSSRSNLPFRFCHAGCNEKPTEVQAGEGGGEDRYPGWANWQLGRGADGFWETWYGRRGDVARALFYLDVRYEGDFDGSGQPEPDLVLTDDLSRLASDSTASAAVAHMGRLTDLLVWHLQDPVDDRERHRNEAVYAYQGNRNPFIDHPEWAGTLYGAGTGGARPVLSLGEGRFDLSVEWATPQGESGQGMPQRLTADSGYFWFFRPGNIELMVKVLDGCAVNGRYWVFAAGLTNVGVTLTVEDTEAGRSLSYENPAGSRFMPVQDTGAFATCDAVAPPPGGDGCPACCKICRTGASRACGDSCISLDKTCHQPPGCACDEAELPPQCR